MNNLAIKSAKKEPLHSQSKNKKFLFFKKYLIILSSSWIIFAIYF